jgi:uncharacterized protein YecT (DUF1311 family)
MTRAAVAVFVLFTLSSTQAPAQTAEDSAAVEACLKVAEVRREAANKDTAPDAKPGPEAHLDAVGTAARYAAESCIGIVADPCLQTEEGSSTYGMMACIGRELDVWDARLNAAYKDALSPDPDSGINGNYTEIQQQQYRKIQRSWIPWRDATCEVLHADGIPIYGSDSKVSGVYCNMLLTAEQALRLTGALSKGFDN